MTTPQYVMDDVKLLLNDLTSPETGVKFTPQPRPDLATIQNNIFPPKATWTWADANARLALPVNEADIGKYGLQIDVNTLFRLTSITPAIVWQPFPTGTTSTWTWPNQAARENEKVTADDVGKIGVQSDINTLFQLIYAAPPVWKPVPNPTNTSTPFELSTGASDADSYHDFYRLQIAFEDVWSELLDTRIAPLGQQLFAAWDALMDQSGTFDDSGATDRGKLFPVVTIDPTTGEPDIAGADELAAFVASLKTQMGIGGGATASTPTEMTQLKDAVVATLQGCDMLLQELNKAGRRDIYGFGQDLVDSDFLTNTTDDDLKPFHGAQRGQVFQNILKSLGAFSPTTEEVGAFLDLPKLLHGLNAILNEPYRFDVYAPASINYGLLLNYRQHWRPQSYQVGNLVSSIPLAPQETRRYTTKTVVKKTRNVKEIDDSLRSSKSDSSDTWRVDSEIVDRAKNQTNFQKTASGSFGNDNLYKVSAGMQQGQDQAVESAQTKREFHESVVKAAQEYRNQHRIEITTEESREDETTSYREIRNPNDELTVTYLFYELQRRYLVDEKIYKATPVVLVANEVPAPQEIDAAWLLRYDWILKRTILDDSFVPALDYLSTAYTGEELTLTVLGLAVEQQKAVVDRISVQVQLANAQLDTATLGLVSAENTEVQDLKDAETLSIVKSFFDPLGLTGSKTDGNADRARVDFAKDALNRAQTKVNQLVSDMKTETTALGIAIDKYTRAATHHFSMLADIDRLRGHVKDNIIYYMQAIWTYEPADQRYFRLCNYDVPVFTHNTTVGVEKAVGGLSMLDTSRQTIGIKFAQPHLDGTLKLHQVADIENLIGFKGNYMIFPMVNFNYMNWFMMQPYLHLDDATGVTVQDPDPNAGFSMGDLIGAMQRIAKNNPASFEQLQPQFEEIMTRLLSTSDPEMVIVPSNSLYIEALPGTHPLLEDFKLIHRAIDVKKAQAEARHAELENLRLASRIAAGTLGDPDIEKVVVVGTGTNVTVDAGQ